jgi:hypothetical protein
MKTKVFLLWGQEKAKNILRQILIFVTRQLCSYFLSNIVEMLSFSSAGSISSRRTIASFDLLGFPNNNSSTSGQQQADTNLREHQLAIEKIWFQYIKSVGGADNLKPVGIFTPSEDLCQLVRRGVPIASRGLIWNKISLSDNERRKFPSSHYQRLLLRTDREISFQADKEINKDIDR